MWVSCLVATELASATGLSEENVKQVYEKVIEEWQELADKRDQLDEVYQEMADKAQELLPEIGGDECL